MFAQGTYILCKVIQTKDYLAKIPPTEILPLEEMHFYNNACNSQRSSFYTCIILMNGRQLLPNGNFAISSYTHLTKWRMTECSYITWYIKLVQEDSNLQDLINTFDPEVLLARPIKYIKQWITNSQAHMQAYWKAAELKATLHTPDI